MIYFDTDVLINLLIPQDKAKHLLARTVYHTATDKHQFFRECNLNSVWPSKFIQI